MIEGREWLANHLQMGFSRPCGAAGDPYMVDLDFAWLEGGRVEDWLMNGLVEQVYFFLFLQFAQLGTPEKGKRDETGGRVCRIHHSVPSELNG